MVDDVKKDFADIKAGVSGGVGGAPDAPGGEDAFGAYNNNSNPQPAEQPTGSIMPGVPEAPAAPQQGGFDDVPSPSDGGLDDFGSYAAPQAQPQQEMAMPGGPASNPSMDVEKIHEIIEKVVSEKWDDMIAKVGDISAWKQKVDMNLLGAKQEIVRVTGRVENIQNAVLGKVQDYDQGMKDVHSELKALEKVLEKIMEPLVTNIKELQKVTQDLKGAHHSRRS